MWTNGIIKKKSVQYNGVQQALHSLLLLCVATVVMMQALLQQPPHITDVPDVLHRQYQMKILSFKMLRIHVSEESK